MEIVKDISVDCLSFYAIRSCSKYVIIKKTNLRRDQIKWRLQGGESYMP